MKNLTKNISKSFSILLADHLMIIRQVTSAPHFTTASAQAAVIEATVSSVSNPNILGVIIITAQICAADPEIVITGMVPTRVIIL